MLSGAGSRAIKEISMPRAQMLWSAARHLTVLVAGVAFLALAADAQGQPIPVGDELLIGFRSGVSEANAEAVYRAHGADKIEKLRAVNIHRVRVNPAAAEALARVLVRHGAVTFVEPNHWVAPAFVPNDSSYSAQWHLPKISAPAAWDITEGTPGIVIGILDSGVDPAHPDLAPKLVAGYNFYDNNADTTDVFGHGTLVAGTAAALGNNTIGVTGVGILNRVMPIRVAATNGYATWSAIVNGLTWGVDHGARVMNLSFAGIAASASVTTAAQYVTGKGGIVVAAAGNCGCWDATMENPSIVSVSATDPSDNLASWSSQGNYVDVSAPGVGIMTTARGGGYASVSGTSFSSPMTAGVIALMLSVNPGLSPQTAAGLLRTSSDDRGVAGYDPQFGAGRVNAYRAVAAALAAVTSDTVSPVVSISSPSSGGTVGGTITVSVGASDNTGVARVDLYVDGALSASDAASPFAASWNTTTLANGSHTLVARAYDRAGNVGVSAPVVVNVSNAPVDRTPPSTQIVSMWTQGNSLKVNVAAQDDVAVVKVELYVDGTLKAASSGPTTFSLNVKSLSPGSHTLQSRAYDAAGNTATSGAGTTFLK
jgi:subtilisin family serine protease